jgi:hypothetical protein
MRCSNRPSNGRYTAGCAVVSGSKSDSFQGFAYLIDRWLQELARKDPALAERQKQRVEMLDYALTDPISPYGILQRWPEVEPEAFAGHRADLLFDLLPDTDALNLARPLLKTLLHLASEPEIAWSMPLLVRALDDDRLLGRAMAACRTPALVSALRRQLATVSKPTLAALRRRLEVLVSSESVRMALSGQSAPDFRRIQDDAHLVAFNCAGPNIPTSVARFLQMLIIDDLCRATAWRQNPENEFLVVIDESQDILQSPVMRQLLGDATRLSRAFGTRFLFLTQNLTAAVSDPKLLRQLHTNVEWSLSFRGEPDDCAFLKTFLPVTGRRAKPKSSPFEETSFYSISQERAMLLDDVACLPNRVGYLLFRGLTAEAIKLRTADFEIPRGRALEEATYKVRHDPTIGKRIPRKEYEQMISEQERRWSDERAGSGAEVADLERAYRRLRGEQP